MSVYLSHIDYELGQKVKINDRVLKGKDNDHNDKGTYYLDSSLLNYDIIERLLDRIVQEVPVEKIHYVIYCEENHSKRNVYSQNRFNLLLHRHGFKHTFVLKLSFTSCNNYISAIHMASSFIEAQKKECNILVISKDEGMYDSIHDRIMPDMQGIRSDGVVCCILSNEKGQYLVEQSSVQEDLSLYTKTKTDAYNILYTTNKFKLIRKSAIEVDILNEDFDAVFMNNYKTTVVDTFAQLIRQDKNKVYYDNISRFSHIAAGDALVNLKTYSEHLKIQATQKMLLFSDFWSGCGFIRIISS